MSLAASSTAFVLMALNLFLATRPRFVEPVFGGLDRIYRYHRGVGIAALALILTHYFLKPSFEGSAVSRGQNELGATLGTISFYGLVALILFSLVKNIPKTSLTVPYHVWRPSHRLIGLLFILIAGHQFLIKKPSGFSYSMLQTYLNVFALIGVVSFLWTQLAPFLRRRSYEVAAVTPGPAGTQVALKPLGRRLGAHPGQFGFVKVDRAGLREPHPFTIAGHDSDGALRFVIKPLGDFTKRLAETLAVGDKVKVEGGYGRFGHRKGSSPQLWLAGGIGITPFLAMAEKLQPGAGRKIHLVHVVGDEAEAVGQESFAACAARCPDFSYTLYESKKQGRIDADRLIALAGFELDRNDLWFCGPYPLRAALVEGLKAKGKKPILHFERFEFR